MEIRRRSRRGSALLAVLWLAAALSAIAFTVASSVRTETERTSTDVDALKAYYLATGAIERALLYMELGSIKDRVLWVRPTAQLRFQFPTGDAYVEIIPEQSKLNVNLASEEDLRALLLTLGVAADRAQLITEGIKDWRSPSPGGFTAFDQYYLGLSPSFRARHASFQEIEELLLVRGVTPDLFHGGYYSDAQGNLVPRPGLKDCLSVWGSPAAVEVNTANAALLQAIGISTPAVQQIVNLRRISAITTMDQLAAFRDGEPGFQRLTIGGGPVYTLRATARLRLPDGKPGDLERSVAETVKILGLQTRPPHAVLRWYDNAYSTK